MKKRIKIFRASPGNISGAIHEIGIAELPVFEVSIGTRVCSVFGNGCPTSYLERTPHLVHYVHLEGRDYVVNLECDEPRVVLFTEPAANGPLFTIPEPEPEREELTIVDTQGRHIPLSQVGYDRDSVEYRTKGGSHCKLQRIKKGWWGFVYLNRPALEPVFVRDTAEKAVLAAMEKHTVLCCR